MGERVALCHEWLVHLYWSEETFAGMAQAAPGGERRGATPALARLGPLRDRRDMQLPLMPIAWRYATRRRYDLVVTSSHACAKGFWPAREALHLCYCYTPLRYV